MIRATTTLSLMLAGTLALGTLTIGALTIGALSASAQGLRGHNSNAPVDFSADRIEVQDRSDRVVVSGNVQVTQADLHLTATRLTVAYRRGSGVEINRMDAIGNVVVTRENETAKGDVAIYDLDKRIITMIGNVQLNQGGNRAKGNRLTIDLASGNTSFDGRSGGAPCVQQGGGGRVTGSFKVKQQ